MKTLSEYRLPGNRILKWNAFWLHADRAHQSQQPWMGRGRTEIHPKPQGWTGHLQRAAIVLGTNNKDCLRSRSEGFMKPSFRTLFPNIRFSSVPLPKRTAEVEASCRAHNPSSSLTITLLRTHTSPSLTQPKSCCGRPKKDMVQITDASGTTRSRSHNQTGLCAFPDIKSVSIHSSLALEKGYFDRCWDSSVVNSHFSYSEGQKWWQF